MEIAFVAPALGNHFMTELLGAIAHEVARPGVRTRVVADRFPPLEDTDAYVIVPHEYFALSPRALWPSPRHLQRTIALCVEQPGTKWFEFGYRGALRAGAVLDLDPSATEELRRRGLPAEHFQLGYTSYWDDWGRDEGRIRDLDVLFLGSATRRREEIIAGYGEALWAARTKLVLSPVRPKPRPREDYLTDGAKRAELRRASVLLNVHRGELPYFEWTRVVEAICNGCVVVSEHSCNHDPLRANEHFLSGAAPSLGLLARGLLQDPDRLRAIRLAAYDFLVDELPMRPAADRLLAIATDLAGQRGARRLLGTLRPGARVRAARASGRALAVSVAGRAASAAKEVLLQDPEISWIFRGASELDFQIGKVRAAVKRVALEQLATQRRLETVAVEAAGGALAPLIDIARTHAYDGARPEVSVLVPLHNYSQEVSEALTSAAASEGVRVEVIVLDDASTDASRATVEAFLRSRPGLAGRLVAHPRNLGLGRTRNALARLARSDLVFFLDADNRIYPSALARLTDALRAAPDALFAYGMLAKYRAGRPSGLVSFRPWEPERLRDGNYIDAMALFRRDRLLGLGGFDEDIRMTGWEDYDLWCRCAERGERAVLVPEIVARYRESDHSMLSLTGIDHQVNWSLLVSRHPNLLRGAEMPWRMRSLQGSDGDE